jgi:hypothetical protein
MKATNLDQVLYHFNQGKSGLRGQELRAWFIERPATPRNRMRTFLTRMRQRHQVAHVLLVGHRGCGKSTELNKLIEEMHDDYLAVTFNLMEVTGRTTVGYEDVMLAMATQVMRFCIDNNLVRRPLADTLSTGWQAVRDWWLQVIAGSPVRPGGSELASFAALNTLLGEIELGVKQSSQTREQVLSQINQQMPELIRWLNYVIDEAQSALNPKRLLIVVEGLDKVDLESARNVFRDHAPTLTSVQSTMIFTFPIPLRYSDDYQQVRNAFDGKVHVLHNFAPRHADGVDDELGSAQLRRLVLARMEEHLIVPEALDFLVEMTGGVLSHLVQMVQNAVLYAQDRQFDAERIELVDVQRALRELRDELSVNLSRQDWRILAARHHDRDPAIDDATQLLFYKNVLIEYSNDRAWCDVHPALWGLLDHYTLEGADDA